jgi:hypothetical protein
LDAAGVGPGEAAGVLGVVAGAGFVDAGVGLAAGVGFGAGLAVGFGVGLGVGFGVGAAIATDPGDTFFSITERAPAPLPLVASKR